MIETPEIRRQERGPIPGNQTYPCLIHGSISELDTTIEFLMPQLNVYGNKLSYLCDHFSLHDSIIFVSVTGSL